MDQRIVTFLRVLLISVIAITVTACNVRADAVPTPALKPPTTPWWFLASVSIGRCVPTKMALSSVRKGDAELLYWTLLAPLNGVSTVAQLWGTPAGDVRAVANEWMLLVHTANGLTCEIAKGKSLPRWAAYIGGRRS